MSETNKLSRPGAREDSAQDVVGDEGGAAPLGSASRVNRGGTPPRERTPSKDRVLPIDRDREEPDRTPDGD
jgi:hypothetical protein